MDLSIGDQNSTDEHVLASDEDIDVQSTNAGMSRKHIKCVAKAIINLKVSSPELEISENLVYI